MMIRIRKQEPQDIRKIREVNKQAFGKPQEADIIDKLRRNCDGLLCLVAVVHKQVVGHILFSPATVESEDRTVEGMSLAPMAVLPAYQRQGIGSELENKGVASTLLTNNQNLSRV